MAAVSPRESSGFAKRLAERKPATLELADGSVFHGYSFGYPESTAGEVVFNTGMVGYPESLTDPSYAGQVLVLTYPLVGNYGVPPEEFDEHELSKYFESDRIHVKALVVSDYSFEASHHSSQRTLGDWLYEQNIPGIYGVDTRAITKRLRSFGAILGKVLIGGSVSSTMLPWDDPNARNLVAEVSRKEKKLFKPVPVNGDEEPVSAADGALPPRSGLYCSGKVRILAVDCGIKNNIIRFLVNVLGVELNLVPWDYDFTKDEFDGLFLSNGPGDPTACEKLISHVRTVMQERQSTPIFGICLGNQILALAAGATTYKMKFGNRGMNQPCVDLRTARCYITPQNHGYAVDAKSLPAGWTPLMVNANDGSNEGIINNMAPRFSVQFHPEACGGPTDTSFLFEEFIRTISQPMSALVTTIPYSLPRIHRKVLVLGSGGLSIGQAGEFDYSGSQAIKALRESGVSSIVINPNVATVQTSWGLADRVYFLPVDPHFVTEVIKREHPDGILCTFGGQTALNCAIKLEEQGVFEQYNVQVLGTPIQAIIMTEDRELFAQAVDECGYKVAESACCDNVTAAVETARRIGYPVLVRAAFALGGLGSGFAADDKEVSDLVQAALVNSPQVIIDKSLRGWKELEYEVVRDSCNNCITVCNMENFDPMGVHTGDSIVIAPSQTLTNSDYHRLRECALKVVRHLGVVGECNIQYAVDPVSHSFRIIEVNARLSRSSALASKATGYPLAYVAAKLALGHDLVKLRNAVTLSTTACFEPSLDYVVAKVPRWDLKKFQTVDPAVGSCMKSVGEVMAIGRKFEEVIQKALRMVDEHCQGFDSDRYDLEYANSSDGKSIEEHVRTELQKPTPMRMWAIAKAFDLGISVKEVHALSKIDLWFLSKLYRIHETKEALKDFTHDDLAQNVDLLREAKCTGFGDRQIAALLKEAAPQAQKPSQPSVDTEAYTGGKVNEGHIRKMRLRFKVQPVVKQIDTLAAEFPARTNYLYLTYNGEENDVKVYGGHGGGPGSFPASPRTPLPRMSSWDDPSGLQAASSAHGSPVIGPSLAAALQIPDPEALARFTPPDRAIVDDGGAGGNKSHTVIVLGCGPYRIGSSVEFDWCSMSAVRTLRSLGHEAVVINCNPETVSTDFDESDRLYFEELSLETVLGIHDLESPGGVIVSVGGQTPNNLAVSLHKNGVRILGTSVEAIDACENRFKFSQLCDHLKIDQPLWSEFTDNEEAYKFCRRVGYPTLVRPSYVLSGAAMRVVFSDEELTRFLRTAAIVSRDHPVVISKYISGAKEVELDAVGQHGQMLNYAIAEHIENAGVHSGDATLLLPAQKLFVETHRRVKMLGQKICRALKISGPFNVQFICKENEVKVIECNLRASRSFPFISKTFNVNFIELATRIMLGLPQRSITIQPIDMEYVACKAPVFSWQRLQNSDPRLGVEMQSTGEVACFGSHQYEAFLKALIATGHFSVPTKNILVSIGPSALKNEFIVHAKTLLSMGFHIFATKGTYEVFKQAIGDNNGALQMLYKPLVQREPNSLSMLKAGKLDLVINAPDSVDSQALSDGFRMRRAAIDSRTPLITDMKVAIVMVMSLERKWRREASGRAFFSFMSWQEYTETVPRPVGMSA